MAKLVIRTDGLPAEVIKLKNGITRFGRSSGNDIQIQHPSISRFHCEIEVREDAMFVRDMDSSNGTFVNDEPVGEAQLEAGHLLRLGEVNMEVKEAPKGGGENDILPCHNHPNLPASMKCTQCGKVFCGSCVHLLKRLNNQYLRLCPVCSGHCHPLAENAQTRKTVIGNLVSAHFMTTLINKILRRKPPEKPFDDGTQDAQE
jgi:FHA domain